MSKIEQAELHVNIDHVATVRQARRTFEPSPLEVVKILEETTTAGITTHLREDRRHIQDSDIYAVDEYLRSGSKLGLTFEMAATEEIRTICLKTAAKLATLVPEKREEVTTEGGMDAAARKEYLKEFIKPIQANGTKVSLFIDPIQEQVDAAKEIGSDFIELHTGTYANLFIEEHANLHQGRVETTDSDFVMGAQTLAELKRLQTSAKYATSIGLNVNLGHGLTVANLPPLLANHPLTIEGGIPEAQELHIGHSLFANAIYYGVKESTESYLKLLNAKTSRT